MDGPRSRGYGARSGYDIRTRRLRGGPEGRGGVNRDVHTGASVCCAVGASDRRRGEAQGRLDSTATYYQRGAGGRATGGLHGHVSQQPARGVGATEAVAGAGWVEDWCGDDGDGMGCAGCREYDGGRASFQDHLGEAGRGRVEGYG